MSTNTHTLYVKCEDIVTSFPNGIGSADLPLIVTGFCFDGNSPSAQRISENSVFEFSDMEDCSVDVMDFATQNPQSIIVTRILIEPLPIPCMKQLQINEGNTGITFTPSQLQPTIENRFHIYFNFTTNGKPYFCVIDPQLKVQQPPRP